VTSLVGGSGFSTLRINASSGGKVLLNNLTNQSAGRVDFDSDGANSLIDLSKLPQLFSDAASNSGLEASNSGSILTPALKTLNRGDVQLDDSKSTINTSQI